MAKRDVVFLASKPPLSIAEYIVSNKKKFNKRMTFERQNKNYLFFKKKESPFC